MHTGQHYDRELSEVFVEELGLPSRATASTCRLPIRTSCSPSIARVDPSRGAGPRARLRRHELDARRRARVGRGVGPARARRSGAAQRRPGDARGTRPHRGRPAVLAALLPGRPLPARPLPRRASWGRRTSSATSWPRRATASRRSPASAFPIPFEPRHLRRRDRPPAGERLPAAARPHHRGAQSPERARRLPGPPAHAGADRARGHRARAARPHDRSVELPRARLARLAGARDRDRLRRPPEGGVLVRGSLRDARPSTEWVETVEVGRERPRGRRPGCDRGGGDRRDDAGAAPAALRRRPRLGADRQRAVATMPGR